MTRIAPSTTGVTTSGTKWTARAVVAAVAIAALNVGVASRPITVTAAEVTPLPELTADWLTTVNAYRTQSGLAPVTENAEWSAGLAAHFAYLANTPADQRTGPYASAHTENPASAWYTAAGAAAGSSSNLLFGTSSPARAIDAWMSAPFHAIGILRPGLTRSAFAMSGSMAGLDVIRGLQSAPTTSDIVFPGDGATTRLVSTGGESPDPTEGCSSNPAVTFSGLPLIVMGAVAPPAGTTARLDLPNGSTLTQGADLCVQTPSTYDSSDPVYGSSGESILAGANATFIIPRVPLTAGRYTAHLVRPGMAVLSWSFTVITPPAPPAGVRVTWAGPGKVLVSWDAPAGEVTSYTVQANGGAAVAFPASQRSAVVDAPTGASSVLQVTVHGSNGAGNGNVATGIAYLPRLPGRIPVAAAGRVVATATGAPAGSAAVLANVAMTDATAPGYTTADRCDRLVDGPQSQASGNHPAQDAVSNLAVVAVGSEGAFCVYNQVPTHLVIDVQGTFSPQGALRFQPLTSERLLDTRSGPRPASGQIVAVSTGAPAGTRAVLVNLAMVDATAPGYITADACSALQPGPQAKATGNHGAGGAVSNLAVVPVDADGRFCIYTQVPTHLVADVQGAFGPAGTTGFALSAPDRRIDTRTDGVAAVAGSITRVQSGAPAGTLAALVNIAMVDAAAAGYITADRCDRIQPGPQTRASGNHPAGGAVANLAVVPVDAGGGFCIYSNVATELVVDVQGSFAPGAPLAFDLASPRRVLDTRS